MISLIVIMKIFPCFVALRLLSVTFITSQLRSHLSKWSQSDYSYAVVLETLAIEWISIRLVVCKSSSELDKSLKCSRLTPRAAKQAIAERITRRQWRHIQRIWSSVHRRWRHHAVTRKHRVRELRSGGRPLSREGIANICAWSLRSSLPNTEAALHCYSHRRGHRSLGGSNRWAKAFNSSWSRCPRRRRWRLRKSSSPFTKWLRFRSDDHQTGRTAAIAMEVGGKVEPRADRRCWRLAGKKGCATSTFVLPSRLHITFHPCWLAYGYK